MSEPVVLTSVPLEPLAQPILDYLADNGVESWILSEDGGGMFPSLDFIQGIHIVVGGDQLAQAKQLLADFEAMSAVDAAQLETEE